MVKVSIVIPALNEAGLIAATIERALAASPHELLLVDGGSDDGTAEIAASYDCRVMGSPAGRAWQQNYGARVATGDVLLFLHADCWLAPPALQQIRRACTDSRVGAGAFRQRIDAAGLKYRWLEWGNDLRVKACRMPYGDQGIFVRRSLFEELGGFPEVRLMEDVLIMRKLRRRTRVVLLPGPITISPRRWQKHGVVRQTARNWLLLSAQRLGVPPNRLARYYPAHRDNAGERQV